jgi:flagellin-like protein
LETREKLHTPFISKLAAGRSTMNIEKVHRKNRKAISPVLATVILIAITLIAAVAIATFVFGIFGTSASPATLSIVSSSVVCGHTAGTCTMNVANSGTAGGSITGAGPGSGSGAAVSFSSPSVSIPAGSAGTAVTVTITLSGGGAPPAGQTVSGYLTQGNGPSLFFTAVVQA